MYQTIRVLTSLAALGILAFVSSLNAQNASDEDRNFVEATARASRHAVYLGELGLANGSATAVKGFSQRLVNDHKRMHEELEAIAKQKGITLPAPDPSSGVSLPISQKTGAEFDITFAREMADTHLSSIALFERELKSGRDADIKKWAEKTLPILRAHLNEAQTLLK